MLAVSWLCIHSKRLHHYLDTVHGVRPGEEQRNKENEKFETWAGERIVVVKDNMKLAYKKLTFFKLKNISFDSASAGVMWMQCPRRPEEGAKSPTTWVEGPCGPSCRCWKWKQPNLKKQPALWTANSSRSPLSRVLKFQFHPLIFQFLLCSHFITRR